MLCCHEIAMGSIQFCEWALLLAIMTKYRCNIIPVEIKDPLFQDEHSTHDESLCSTKCYEHVKWPGVIIYAVDCKKYCTEDIRHSSDC